MVPSIFFPMICSRHGAAAAPAAAKWEGKDRHGGFFGATPFRTLGNAPFEDRNTPF